MTPDDLEGHVSCTKSIIQYRGNVAIVCSYVIIFISAYWILSFVITTTRVKPWLLKVTCAI